LADSDYETALDAAQESETLATNPSFTAIAMRVDMTDLVSVAEMVGAIMRVFGRVDYYVNITGAQKRLSTAAMDREAWERTRQASLEGTLHGIRAVTQVMRNQSPGKYKARGRVREGSRGTIINVGLRNLVMAERAAQDAVDEQGVLDLMRKTGE
jgi:NAD(P)-dependent dehydrogenase (short-subunit alcohol dehydrogenase family)